MKRYKSTLIMATVLAVLLGWYFVYEKHFRAEHKAKEDALKRVFQTPQDKVQYVLIEKLDAAGKVSSTLSLKKLDDRWMLTTPVAAPADDSSVKSLVSSLTGVEEERVVEEKAADLKLYGLDAPSFQITLTESESTDGERILIGKDTPVGYTLYAMKAGTQRVAKVSKSLKASVEKPVNDFRAKTLLPHITRSDIREIEIQSGAQKVLLALNTDTDKWTLPRVHLPADKEKIVRLLNVLLDTRVKDYLKSGSLPAGHGLKNPRFTIQLKKDEKTRPTLKLGERSGKYFATVEGSNQIFEIPDNVLNRIESTNDSYIDMAVADFSRFTIQKILIERPEDAVELTKSDGTWTETKSKQKAETAEVDKWLATLQDMKLLKYTPASQKLAQTDVTIKLFEKTDATSTPKVELLLTKPLARRSAAQRAGENLTFQIADDDFKKLNAPSKTFLQPQKADAESEKPKSSS